MATDDTGDDRPTALARALAEARRLLAIDAADFTVQPLFEQWLKAAHWQAHSEALPLLVGCAPAHWSLPSAGSARRAATPLWRAFAEALSCELEDDPPVTPFRLREWARQQGLELPLALSRVLDFIGSVLPSLAVPAEDAPTLQHGEDRVTLLGAALSIVTRNPERCVNDAGYYDAGRIAAQVFKQAVVWFPLGPPSLSQAEAVALIARWLPRTTVEHD